jgi:hypothetical protein
MLETLNEMVLSVLFQKSRKLLAHAEPASIVPVGSLARILLSNFAQCNE